MIPEHGPWVPHPSNADVQHCQWYLSSAHGGSRTVRVHLWGSTTEATDSYVGLPWLVRRCLVCGAVDEESLVEQQAQHQKERER